MPSRGQKRKRPEGTSNTNLATLRLEVFLSLIEERVEKLERALNRHGS